MKRLPCRLRRILPLLMLMASAQAQSPEVVDIENAASGSQLRDVNDEFVLDLTLEPLAGQTLQAGAFEVEFISVTSAGAEPAGVPIFADGFEPAGVSP